MPVQEFENSIEYRYLQQSNDEFHEMEQHMQDHHHAMDCRDCEEFIKKGIEVCGWFDKFQDTISFGMRTGRMQYSSELQDFFRLLATSWLATSKLADVWISKVEKLDYSVENKQEFLRCRENMQEWIETTEYALRARKTRLSLYEEQ